MSKDIMTALIDQRLEIASKIDTLEAAKKEVGEQIQKMMQEQGLKKAFGSALKGFQLVETISQSYTAEAIAYAIRNKIIHLFTPPPPSPSITRAKVLEALKKNNLTKAQFDRLQKCASPSVTTYTLKTVEEKPDAPVS